MEPKRLSQIACEAWTESARKADRIPISYLSWEHMRAEHRMHWEAVAEAIITEFRQRIFYGAPE